MESGSWKFRHETVKMLSYFRSKPGGKEAVGDRLPHDAQLLLRGPGRLPHVLPLLRLGRPRAQVLRRTILPPSETRVRLASHRAEASPFSDARNLTEFVWCASVLEGLGKQLRKGNKICPKASSRYFPLLSAFGIDTQCKIYTTSLASSVRTRTLYVNGRSPESCP